MAQEPFSKLWIYQLLHVQKKVKALLLMSPKSDYTMTGIFYPRQQDRLKKATCAECFIYDLQPESRRRRSRRARLPYLIDPCRLSALLPRSEGHLCGGSLETGFEGHLSEKLGRSKRQLKFGNAAVVIRLITTRAPAVGESPE